VHPHGVEIVGDDEWDRCGVESVCARHDQMAEPGGSQQADDHLGLCLNERWMRVHGGDGSSGADVLTCEFVILSDRSLREQINAGRIVIEPLDEALIQPSSIDVRISNLFRVFRNHTRGVIDVKVDTTDLTEMVEIPPDGSEPFMLHPGEFVLGSTLERVVVPDDLVARIEGKSSLGRLGLLIHSTAGFIDAGFDGHVTLELANVASLPITLYPGMKIGQVSFMQMTTPADNPYGKGAKGSKYQGQRGPTPSRYFENFAAD
jgi:dCTP deaminase